VSLGDQDLTQQPCPIRLKRELSGQSPGVTRLTSKSLKDPKPLPSNHGPSKRLAKHGMRNRHRSKPQTKNSPLNGPISLNVQPHEAGP